MANEHTSGPLGDGASLTKWFQSQDEANSYAGELAKWLAQGRE